MSEHFSKFFFDITNIDENMFDKEGKRSIPWSEEIFIREIGVKIKKKMEIELNKKESYQVCKYFWEITNPNGEKGYTETVMNFSTYSVDEYVDIFKDSGFVTKEIIKTDITSGDNNREHYFVEMKLK